jgi:dTDP-4-dehydrorhamnose reductase
MSKLMQERATLNVVKSNRFSTYAADLAQAIVTIINHANWQPEYIIFRMKGKSVGTNLF